MPSWRAFACLQAKEDRETSENMEAITGVEQRHVTVEEAQVRQ